MKDFLQYLKLFTGRKVIAPRLVNLIVWISFTYVLLSNIWNVGRKVDETLSYLEEIPHLRQELVVLKQEKASSGDSLRLFRVEVANNFRNVASNLDQMDERIRQTNQSVKTELKRMNDYFILLSYTNEEIKRMLMIKKDNDNMLYDQLFPSGYSTSLMP